MKELKLESSKEMMMRAMEVIPGGVNSPVRAMRAVGGDPFFAIAGQGPLIFDIDGNRYVDLVLAWGPLILGHRPPLVMDAIGDVLRRGWSFGVPTVAEVEMAELIRKAIPSMEMVRLVNSGTEATMSAIRVARAYTKRSKIIKFAGCYHGHADYLLVKAGSGATSFGQPDSAGVPMEFVEHTISLPFNNKDALREAFQRYGSQIAAVIVELYPGNMGVVLPEKEFLDALITIPKSYGALLIADEVMTGFRVAWGGAQARLGIRPDLTCLGKVIGGGLPIGAYGGRRDIMQMVSPLGPVYQAGTMSGNPIAVSAGLFTLKILERDNPYEQLEKLTERLCKGIEEAAYSASIPIRINKIGSMFTVFFTSNHISDYDSALKSDTKMYSKFFHAMRRRGVFLPPSQFEAAFLSTAHQDTEIEHVVEAARESFREIKGE